MMCSNLLYILYVGCALCMGQAVDKDLLSLIEQDVKELIKKYKENEADLADIQVSLESQLNEQAEMQTALASLQEQQEEHDDRFKAIQQWREQQMRETKEILKLLTKFAEKTVKQTSELEIRVEEVERDLSVLKRSLSESNLAIEERVKQLERNVKEQGAKEDGQGKSINFEFNFYVSLPVSPKLFSCCCCFFPFQDGPNLFICAMVNRAVTSRESRGATVPTPSSPDLLSHTIFMDLFSLGSVILIIVTCNCLPLAARS